MRDLRGLLERVGDGVHFRPGAFDRVVAKQSRRARTRRIVTAVASLSFALAGFVFVYVALVASQPAGQLADEAPAASPDQCERIVPDCRMLRLADRVLRGQETYGALGSVVGDAEGTIGFDEALRRAWAEDAHPDATAVQITLGSADAAALNWPAGSELFYSVTWYGTCAYSHGGAFTEGQGGTCKPTDWATVVEAQTGAFVVGSPTGQALTVDSPN